MYKKTNTSGITEKRQKAHCHLLAWLYHRILSSSMLYINRTNF